MQDLIRKQGLDDAEAWVFTAIIYPETQQDIAIKPSLTLVINWYSS